MSTLMPMSVAVAAAAATDVDAGGSRGGEEVDDSTGLVDVDGGATARDVLVRGGMGMSVWEG